VTFLAELEKFTVGDLEDYNRKNGKPAMQLTKEKFMISRRGASGLAANTWACTKQERALQKNWNSHLTEKKPSKE